MHSVRQARNLSLLEHTFVHIPGIGLRTERNLWNKGIRTWHDIEDAVAGSMGRLMADKLRSYIPKSQAAIANRDVAFFERLGRIGEAWRLFADFSENCVYLDIETTGLSPVFDSITMVGLFDGREYKLFIQDQNLDQLPAALKGYSVMVTFNGACFDMRFLKSTFPNIKLPPVHIDLRWLTRKLGHHGGLKEIEAAFGLSRPRRLAGLTGRDATVLWSRYRRGEDSALVLLIEYNTQDVVNLKAIMERSYESLAARTAGFMKHASTPKKQRLRSLPKASNFAPPQREQKNVEPAILIDLCKKARSAGHNIRIVGIDLSGSERNASGWAVLEDGEVTTRRVASDADLIELTLDARPTLVSIDSPLSLPGGLESPQKCREAGLPIYRACELALKRMGISVFWCLLPSMEQLTLRGIRLTRMLREKGCAVIESYPGAAQDLLGIPRKGTSLGELRWGLQRLGVSGTFMSPKVSHDEIDAITSAIVGLYYLAGEHFSLGNALEDYLVVPRPQMMDHERFSSILSATGLDAVPRRDAKPLYGSKERKQQRKATRPLTQKALHPR